MSIQHIFWHVVYTLSFHSKYFLLSLYIYLTHGVFVSYGYFNKLPQTRWLKTTTKYFLTVLETGSPQLGCWQGHTSSEGSKGDPFLSSSSFWWLHVLRGIWLYNSNLCFYLYMAFSVSMHSPFLPFIRTALIGFTAHLDNPRLSHFEILWISNFPNKVPIHSFQGLRHGLILGTTDQPTYTWVSQKYAS